MIEEQYNILLAKIKDITLGLVIIIIILIVTGGVIIKLLSS